jgi:leucyl aminopeptidase
MQIEHLNREFKDVVCDLLAYPVFEDEITDSPSLELLNKLTRGIVKSVHSSGEFKPELGKTCWIHRPPGLKARNLLLIGAAEKTQFDLSKLREVAGTALRCGRSGGNETMAFLCRGEHTGDLASRAIAESAVYANYEADIYKTRDKEQHDVKKFMLLFERKTSKDEVAESIRRAIIVGNATNFARTLVNEPANILTPSQFAERALAIGSQVGLDIEVMERDEMAKLGMNALLAVSRGSDEPPKMLILRIRERTRRKIPAPPYALVGKGVTFDSGGISIKPADKMEDMKADMAGGAAVLAAMVALAQLRPRFPVIGLIPTVENLPSGKATKPGDVVKSYLGKTIEIINTDAEGRLILADALAYAKTLGAGHIVDIATLTAACAVALGNVNAGMMGTDQKTIDRLRSNCSITGERLWQLPLDDAYRKSIRSEIADVKNVGERLGGAINAAKFLQEFVEDTPWVHLDIAGMDIDHDGRPYACKGATGFGVRTLVRLLE